MTPFITTCKSALRTIFTPAPRPAPRCTNISMLLMHLVDFDAAHYAYVLRWLAFPLKNPGAKMHFGLAITGEAGTGKHLFFQKVALALHAGQARIMRPGGEDILNNYWAAGLRLVVVEGKITQQSLSRVRALMVPNSLMIKAADTPWREQRNHLNFVLISNGSTALFPAHGDRRFLAIEAPPARERGFYDAVAHEIEHGGVEAFRQYLLFGLDMHGFDEYTLPPGMDGSGNGGYKGSAPPPVRHAAPVATCCEAHQLPFGCDQGRLCPLQR